MSVGEKVRELRVAKMMSQSELAGNQITRNMISCIENGTAMPSLPTVFYLAKRLGVSVGYLLAEGEDDQFYRKMEQMENVKKAFREGDWESCRALCRSLLGEGDDELLFLLAQCNLQIAKEQFWKGKLHAACRSFDEALELSEKCLYPQPQIFAEAREYFAYMSRISPLLYSEVADENSPADYVMETPFAAYRKALEALDTGDFALAEAFVSNHPEKSFFREHLSAKCKQEKGDLEGAKAILQSLLQGTQLLNEVQLYAVLCDLEIVCRETEDFRAAYRYAGEKVQLHEQLLKD